MRASTHGRINRPVVAVVGVWDPILPAHRQLFEEVSAHARLSSLDAVVVAIDPDPITFLHGPAKVPIYNDVHTRIQLLLGCGLEGVLHIRFSQRDIEGTAADLFALMDTHMRVEELWLGARQSFGRGPDGSAEAISKLAIQYDIRIVRQPAVRLPTGNVRELLTSGHLGKATELVGRPPVIYRPKLNTIRLGWCAGLYRALPLATPDLALEGACVEIRMAGEGTKRTHLSWPDPAIDYLAFISGPGDLPSTGTVA